MSKSTCFPFSPHSHFQCNLNQGFLGSHFVLEQKEQSSDKSDTITSKLVSWDPEEPKAVGLSCPPQRGQAMTEVQKALGQGLLPGRKVLNQERFGL